MEMTEKLALFQELIGCGSTLYTWCYDGEGQLLSSNCPDAVSYTHLTLPTILRV